MVSWNSSVFKKRFQGVQETNFTVLLHILQVVEDIDSETIAEYLGEIVPGLIRVIFIQSRIECVHGGHAGGLKQKKIFA